MLSLRQLYFRFKSLFGRGKMESELEEEVQFHLQMIAGDKIAKGMEASEAMVMAQREFGGIVQMKERYRDERRFGWIEDAWRDFRHSLRVLRRERFFTVTVLIIFSLCVAANVTIFSLVNAILVRPLPFPDSRGIYTIFDSYPKAGVKGGVSVPHYLERVQQIGSFSESSAWEGGPVSVSVGRRLRDVDAIRATPSFFHLFGLTPAFGRTFSVGEGVYGSPRVAILSDEMGSELGGQSAVLGHTIQLNGESYTIIGVMPAHTQFLAHPLIWLPLTFSPDDRLEGMRHVNRLEMEVRLKEGVSVKAAQAQLDELNERTLKLDPFAAMVTSVGFHSTIVTLHARFVSDVKSVLWLLQMGASLLLLIGGVNLANLFLVRAIGRTAELSLRRALGATLLHVSRALIWESLVLCAMGGFLGFVAGWVTLQLTLVQFQDQLPLRVANDLDPTVCAVTLVGSLLFGVLLAAPAVWQAMRGNLVKGLSSESRSGTSTRAILRFRSSLIVAQIALAFLLLAGTALLGFSLLRVLSIDPGFKSENLNTAGLKLGSIRYPDENARLALIERLISAVRNSPGTSDVGIDTGLPFTSRAAAITIAFDHYTFAAGDSDAAQAHFVSGVAGNLFTCLGIPLVQGRLLTDSDQRSGNKVCVIDTDFARHYWPKGDAIGHGITPDMGPNPAYFKIVGIVQSIRQNDLTDARSTGSVYLPYIDFSPEYFLIVWKSSLDSTTALAQLRGIVEQLDPALEVTDYRGMTERVNDSLRGRKMSLSLMAAYAGIALVLAAIGVFGVMAYIVAQRRREIGIRLALGARPRQILQQFLWLGTRLVFLGLVIGWSGSFLFSEMMTAFLYEASPTRFAVIFPTALVIFSVALLASVIPVRRAAQISPSEALRSG